ncbi:hypothetical protein KI811_08815 [Geobacter hydrogenophilus]|uniref:Lipoprotein n=1 Tax=Geobacter hydrogenophilus TaxID=40983 RepID=A0A9W6LCV1_9BACT|nr:hypothetical protein [Geobacter hydrogenophilus]MBT0893911.1 hypothetical protein [Geobacter hydrogenophilus]GLI38144.1 lipoprotein [Geobacter hydrogenophilus]
MKRIVQWIILAALALAAFGCAHDPFNIPRADYEQKVKVLGVAPIFMDADSDIRHPEKDTLVTLVREYNRKNEKELAEMIKESGAYFSVRFLDAAAPDELYRTLLLRAERRDDAGVVYNKQFFKPEEIRTLVTQNNVDAVLLVTVSGLTMRDRIFSSNLVKYLDSDYNVLSVSAQVLDANGATLWEDPNFRAGSPSTPVLAELQYPDFDEGAANMDDRVNVKFKTIPGLTRYLGKKEKDLLFRERKATAPYYHLFDEMVELLKPPIKLFGDEKKGGSQPAPQPASYQPQPAPQPVYQPAPASTAAPAPAAQPAPAPQPETVVLPEPTPVREIPIDTKPAQ